MQVYNSYDITAYFELGVHEILLMDMSPIKSIDEVISYISTFFLRLRESVNYLEVNNANSIIHTIED
jgi:hypothetical protein